MSSSTGSAPLTKCNMLCLRFADSSTNSGVYDTQGRSGGGGRERGGRKVKC